MTCIAAIEHGGAVYIGGDSALSWGESTIACGQNKVWVRRGVAWGYAGAMRPDNIVRTINVTRFAHGDPWRWMLRELVPSLGTAFMESGIDDPPEMDLLVGVGGRVFSVTGSLGVHDTGCGYHVAGSGDAYALGALAALPTTMSPRTRVRKALEAAARHCTTVAGPFHIVSC